MTDTTRVIIADDSAAARQLLSKVLREASGIDVIVEARNGKEAVAAFREHSADVLVLDVQMPVMSGISAAKELRALESDLPIFLFGTVSDSLQVMRLDAKSVGATEFIPKPSSTRNQEDVVEYIRTELVYRIHNLDKCRSNSRKTPVVKRKKATRKKGEASETDPIDLVVIGSSTGGPNALSELLHGIPADFPVPILIAQHMPPVFTTRLAERLNQTCSLNVLEGEDETLCLPGNIWIAPGDYHMTVFPKAGRTYVRLNQTPPENSCRPAVDVLFRSAAQYFGNRVLSVILTGMGQDGLQGCQEIRTHGGYVIAQDKESSTVWGMPGAVINAGFANEALPLNEIPTRINTLVKHRRQKSRKLEIANSN